MTSACAKLDGQCRPAADADHRLPRRVSDDSAIRHPAREDFERLGEFQPGQFGADAVVHAAAEGEDRRRLAGDVKAVGVNDHDLRRFTPATAA